MNVKLRVWRQKGPHSAGGFATYEAKNINPNMAREEAEQAGKYFKKSVAITPYYDSLIGKLICWGETRAEAILRMRRALAEYRIIGVKTNIPFHQAMMSSHLFFAGSFDTTFVEERFSMEDDVSPEQARVAAVIATLVAHQRGQQATQVVRGNSASLWASE